MQIFEPDIFYYNFNSSYSKLFLYVVIFFDFIMYNI